jgi:hypothetical protein
MGCPFRKSVWFVSSVVARVVFSCVDNSSDPYGNRRCSLFGWCRERPPGLRSPSGATVGLAWRKFHVHRSLWSRVRGQESRSPNFTRHSDSGCPISGLHLAVLLLGIEHVRIAPGITRVSPLDFYDYPISHSLLMAAVWSAVVGGTYYRARRYGRGALVVGEPHNDVVSARQRLVNGKTSRPGGTIMPLVITAHHHAAQSGPTRKHTSHNFSVRQLCRLRSAPLDTPENVTISSRVTLYSVTNMGIIRAMRS